MITGPLKQFGPEMQHFHVLVNTGSGKYCSLWSQGCNGVGVNRAVECN